MSSASKWIISPVGDVFLLIAAPLAIFPLFLGWQRLAAPESISLAVFCFASLGHHLPGLMRAYGDRELFARHRLRFLLAPPAVLLLNAAAFVWLELHTMELVLLFWATWHIMMQTYGFMRIYDLKRGRRSILDARWDFAACLAVFAVGIAFSDARMFGVAETLWLAGAPEFGALHLSGFRWLVGLLAAVVLGGALWRAARVGLNPPKVWLLLITGGLYWAAGGSSINLLVGVAMFEVFHAVQYYAIVWLYNRRRAEKDRNGFGAFGFLFRGGWLGAAIYLAAIAAFGSLGYWGRESGLAAVQRWPLALFSTSAMLHFYYDGFIWKVSRPHTQAPLDVSTASAAEPARRPYAHSVQWGALTAAIVGLAGWEWACKASLERQGGRRLELLAALTPELPELQIRLSQAALLQGDAETAWENADRAVRLRPRSYAAHMALGSAQSQRRKWDGAEQSFATASELRPQSAEVWKQWGGMHARQGDFPRAIERYQEALLLEPDAEETHFALGGALASLQRFDEAAQSMRQAGRLRPQWAEAHYQCGLMRVQLRQYEDAETALQRCLQLAPQHAQAHLQMGNIHYLNDRCEQAAPHYRRCVELAPELPTALDNLAASLFVLERWKEAEAAYRRSLEFAPGNAASHYNLGMVLLIQGRRYEARKHILRAAELGRPPGPEAMEALR